LVLISQLFCLAQSSGPAISFEKMHHNFSKVTEGTKVSYEFKVTNQGDAPLTIKEVLTSCGCTYSVVGKWILHPHETTTIDVQFNTTGMAGNIYKSLEVISDDPKKPKSLLTFEANVTYEIMPSTSVLVFDHISRNDMVSSTIRLESGTDIPVTVTSAIFHDAPFLTCEIQQDGNDAILNVSLDGKLLPERVNRGIEFLTVTTTSRKFSRLEFRIHWEAQNSTIFTSHNRILWTGRAGEELKTTVLLKQSEGKTFKLLRVKASHKAIIVAELTKGSLAEHKIEVVLSPKAKAGMYQEILVLTLGDSEQSVLEIPIVAVLK
jgi:hypothetical protein